VILLIFDNLSFTWWCSDTAMVRWNGL